MPRSRLALVLLGLALFLLAAWRTRGYIQADEYFQTVEFASEKLGVTPASTLAWEHREQIRPYLQPAAYAAIAGALRAAGADAPCTALLAFRLLSAVLNLAALLLLWAALARRLPDPRARTWLLAACLLTWYLPLLGARTSSESLSGAFLAAGLAAFLLLERRPLRAGLAAGLLLGLAFDARYQVALSALGLGAWLALVRRAWRPLLALCAGFATAAALGLLLDRWGYGAWTLTPWNYLRANLVEGRASHFGTAPVYQYAVWLLTTRPPLPALLALAVLAFWIRAPRDPLTWMAVPFVLGHCVLAHKELRFLFPLGPLAAGMAALLLLDPALRPRFPERGRRWLRAALAALVALDLAALAVLLASPMDFDLTVQAGVWNLSQRSPRARFFTLGVDPFWDADAHLPITFLRPPGWAPEPADSWEALEARLAGAGPAWVVSRMAGGPPPSFRERHRVRLAVGAVPEWALEFVNPRSTRRRLQAVWEVEP